MNELYARASPWDNAVENEEVEPLFKLLSCGQQFRNTQIPKKFGQTELTANNSYLGKE